MRIAFIVPSLQPTGPIILVQSLSKYLKECGCDIDIYYFDGNTKQLEFKCNTFQIAFSDPIDFDSYDIVHSHCFRADLYVDKHRRLVRNSKTLSTLHQDTYISFTYDYCKPLAHLLTAYWLHIQSKNDMVVAISNQLRDLYRTRLKGKLVTLYNGVDIVNAEKLDESYLNQICSLKQKGYKLLGTCARIVKRKGISQVLLALKELPNHAFVIIGDGLEKDVLIQTARQLEVVDRVLFLSHVDAPYNYLEDIDVYMMTSYSEGFGLAMVEAALKGKAIVCSNIPSFHEIFEETEACFFELDNTTSLIDAVNNAYSTRDVLSRKAQEKATKVFTAEKMAERHMLLYEQLVSKTK